MYHLHNYFSQRCYDSLIYFQKIKKLKKKRRVVGGPTTRLRAMEVTTTGKGSAQEEAADVNIEEPPAPIVLPTNPGTGHRRGTVEDYFLTRFRKLTSCCNRKWTKTDKVPETDFPNIEDEKVEAGLGSFNLIIVTYIHACVIYLYLELNAVHIPYLCFT